MNLDSQPRDAAQRFLVEGQVTAVDPIGDGLIHRSYHITTTSPDGALREYVLQDINTEVFKHPEILMRNVERVLTQLQRAEKANGSWHRLELVPVAGTTAQWLRLGGRAWRMYRLIEGSRTLRKVTAETEAEQIGAAFGRFLRQIEPLPEAELEDALPGYRDTENYYAEFLAAASADVLERRMVARKLEGGFLQHAGLAHRLAQQVRAGELPTRPLHGDTKFNNVLFDAAGSQAICVIDLDTVMIGPVAKDFGDCYRSILLEHPEDRVLPDEGLRLFGAMTQGFARMLRGVLERAEVQSLVAGVQTLLFENGIRFLADYFRGDTYFHTAYPTQNLDRAARHLQALERVSSQVQEMEKLVRQIW